MGTLPVKQTPDKAPSKPIEQRFRELEAIWTAETGYLSSYTDIVEHPAFQEIIRLGNAVVPLMLRDMEDRPRLWVWALTEITGANPVEPGNRGNIARMNEAWLQWGRANGYR